MRQSTAPTTVHPGPAPAAPPPVDRAGLVDRLRRGEPGAAVELLGEFGPGLLATARAIVGDEHAAQDAVQDGIVSALRAIDTLNDPQALGAWLKRTVTNAALVQLRKRRRRRERPIEDLLPTFHDDGHRVNPGRGWAARADERLDRRELLDQVRTAMEDLPEHYREVLTLRDMMGIDTNETAVALGITPNHVKVRLHRARQALRTLMEERLSTP